MGTQAPLEETGFPGMSATTAPAVKARLVELFAGALPEPTEVWRNRPTTQHQMNENVYVGAVKIIREWANLGRPRAPSREENYLVETTVEVYERGTDDTATEERLWELVHAMEAVLIEDVTLGLENVQWAFVEHIEQDSKGGSDGWLCTAVLGVAVKARI
jgi:hypothetical protein